VHGRTPAQIVFRFAIQVGMIPLTGTTDPSHMQDDLDARTLRLSAAEVAELDRAR
jgi:diketogulonate reductase-like aldo/keto reductase